MIMYKRESAIDVMKGILVLFMILAHIIQFFPFGKITIHFSNYVDLTTFSGFMFTFGYVCYKAYISKNISSRSLFKKLFLNFFKTMLAYYISGIAYFAFIVNHLSLENFIKILTFKEIPGYSEFLLSFSFLYLLIFIFKNFLSKMNKISYIIVVILSLLFTFINYSLVKNPFVGVIIGTSYFCCFPIIQYSSYFFAGMYFAQYKKGSKWMILVAFIGSLIFSLHYISNQNLPIRFPPTMLWITGGYAFILLYYYFGQKYSHFLSLTEIDKIGKNSLVYLVVSNIFIFMMTKLHFSYFDTLNTKKKILFYILCFLNCIFLSNFTCKILNIIKKILLYKTNNKIS